MPERQQEQGGDREDRKDERERKCAPSARHRLEEGTHQKDERLEARDTDADRGGCPSDSGEQRLNSDDKRSDGERRGERQDDREQQQGGLLAVRSGMISGPNDYLTLTVFEGCPLAARSPV
jgi:hypothetical protein